jgi:primosomal protein N' (replication factor Y) (superfamily II helicase)
MKLDILLPLKFNHPFTYQSDLNVKLKKGDYVVVPFRNKKITGVVWDLDPKVPSNIKIKKIISNLDIPAMSISNLNFIKKFSHYNLTSLGMVFKLFLYTKGLDSCHKKFNFEQFIIKNFNNKKLNKIQQQSIKSINKYFSFNDYSTTLLHGITGSGKTLVYFHYIKEAIEKGYQVLVLLPEIALTKQISDRFKEFIGHEPATWHSGIKDKDKKIIWNGIVQNKIHLVLGARSSIFLPFQNLKLIIVDEEHDSSYKQDEGVIYNARDMSILKASMEKIPIFLISATPSVESFYNAKKNKYQYIPILERYKNIELAKTKIVNLISSPPLKGKFISESIITELKNLVEKKNQILFFLNRRGYSTYIICYQCNERLICPNCSIGLVYHQENNQALCHYCDFKTNLKRKCLDKKDCKFSFYGLGVEKIFEEVKSIFPEKKIQIFSSDVMHGKTKSNDIINEIEKGDIPILVGTQLISKGFHFPYLNCIVVINSDTNFLGSDIRASEKNFQLLQQLSGRAGRESNNAIVYLQTNDPKNKILRSLSKADVNEFYKEELDFRKNANLPPFSKLISIIVSGANRFAVEKVCRNLKGSFIIQDGIRIYGPVTAPIFRIRNKFRMRLLIKYDGKLSPQDFLMKWIDKNQTEANIKLEVDVDPINFL